MRVRRFVRVLRDAYILDGGNSRVLLEVLDDGLLVADAGFVAADG